MLFCTSSMRTWTGPYNRQRFFRKSSQMKPKFTLFPVTGSMFPCSIHRRRSLGLSLGTSKRMRARHAEHNQRSVIPPELSTESDVRRYVVVPICTLAVHSSNELSLSIGDDALPKRSGSHEMLRINLRCPWQKIFGGIF